MKDDWNSKRCFQEYNKNPGDKSDIRFEPLNFLTFKFTDTLRISVEIFSLPDSFTVFSCPYL